MRTRDSSESPLRRRAVLPETERVCADGGRGDMGHCGAIETTLSASGICALLGKLQQPAHCAQERAGVVRKLYCFSMSNNVMGRLCWRSSTDLGGEPSGSLDFYEFLGWFVSGAPTDEAPSAPTALQHCRPQRLSCFWDAHDLSDQPMGQHDGCLERKEHTRDGRLRPPTGSGSISSLTEACSRAGSSPWGGAGCWDGGGRRRPH